MAMYPTSPIISAKALTRTYSPGTSTIIGINEINLEVFPGQIVVLKGNSGSGKSTLLSLIAGLDHPTRGELTVANHDLKTATPTALTRYRRDVVGMVFQSFNLLPTLNVLENVCLPGLLAGHPDSRVRAKANELLEWLDLKSRLHHRPSELSGGEMQRTAIARALINDPTLILADEPTGNLDSCNGKIVIDLLVDLNRHQGRTVIIATHSKLADAYATLQIYLRDGTITKKTCQR